MKQKNCIKKPFSYQILKILIIIIIGVVILRYLYEKSSLFYSKSFVFPFTMHLNENDLYLVKGEEFRLYIYAINKRVSFQSTDFRVAGVNFNGRVFGYQVGNAFIIAKVGDRSLKCRVHVIDINRDRIVLRQDKTFRLKVLGTNAFVRWRSKDKEIASVNMFGKVTAKNKGSTVIYGKVKGKTLKCTVIVE